MHTESYCNHSRMAATCIYRNCMNHSTLTDLDQTLKYLTALRNVHAVIKMTS